jgi:pectinesterase
MKTILLFIFLFSVTFAFPQKKITVAQDGAGEYRTVQAAFDAIPLNNKKPVTIYIRNGIYKEKLHLDSSKNFVTLIGEDKFNTILTYDDHTGKLSPKGDTINTRTSWSFLIKADDFTARSITFQNDAGYSAGQAVAVESDGDKAIFQNCRFVGNQDVSFLEAQLFGLKNVISTAKKIRMLQPLPHPKKKNLVIYLMNAS